MTKMREIARRAGGDEQELLAGGNKEKARPSYFKLLYPGSSKLNPQ
jgi:hypothetical protein